MTDARAEFTPDIVKLSSIATRSLVSRATSIGIETGWDFPAWERTDVLKVGSYEDALNQALHEAQKKMTRDGYVVVSFGAEMLHHTDAIAATVITYFLTLFGTPIKILKNTGGFWRKIDVDLDRPPNRSRGVGSQSLHMDFVNAEFPPDFVCLYCVRADPLAGGHSIVAKIDGLENALPPEAITELQQPIYSDGVVKSLSHVGRDINPFPVFNQFAKFQFRFTANLLANPPSKSALAVLNKLMDTLNKRAVKFALNQGDILILDQHRALHGRSALAEGQELIAPDRRRLVLHSFLRQREA